MHVEWISNCCTLQWNDTQSSILFDVESGTVVNDDVCKAGVREDRGVSAEVLSAERNAGSIGEGIREIQVQNYLRKMELKKQREEELTEGLKLYK
jgi:hypothetical protein